MSTNDAPRTGDTARDLLRRARETAESLRQHFGNINDINFEPGVATDALNIRDAIDAYLNTPAQQDDALAAAVAEWKCPHCYYKIGEPISGYWAKSCTCLPLRAALEAHPPATDACDGEICVDCCLCAKCGRKVGTPHIDVCACPPEAQHWRCRDCHVRFVAQHLAPYETPPATDAGGVVMTERENPHGWVFATKTADGMVSVNEAIGMCDTAYEIGVQSIKHPLRQMAIHVRDKGQPNEYAECGVCLFTWYPNRPHAGEGHAAECPVRLEEASR